MTGPGRIDQPARVPAAGGVTDTIRLHPVAHSVRTARQFVLACTEGLPAGLRDDLELCVSELATNCVLHAATSFTVTVTCAESVRIDVTDTGPGSAEPRVPAGHDAHGRGLRIIEALADEWGVSPAPTPPGKTVWLRFELVDPR